MEIWTDGTIEPEEALSNAAEILVDHLSLLVGVGEMPPEEEEEAEEALIPVRIYETPIEELELSVRAYNCLKRAGITKVGEILEKMAGGDDEILAIRNFGKKSLAELKERMRAKDFWPIEDEESAEEMAEAAYVDEP
jgi:DNA-directed RNA polymerase subunit alpha